MKSRAGTLTAVFFSFFFAFLLVRATPNSLWVSTSPIEPYARLTEQLVQGKVSMPIEPDPRLATLQNPYSPKERAAAHVDFAWDYSYYKGKYYLYFGVVPPLLVGVPFRLLTGKYLGDAPQVLLFALLAYWFCFLLTIQLYQNIKGVRPDPLWSFFIAATLALCTEFAHTVQQVAVYQIAIFSSVAFLFGGLWAAARSLGERRQLWVAGLLLGLSLGCRPTAMVGFVVLPALIKERRQYLELAKGFAPIAFLLMIYNFVRFDNPFETGFFYQFGVTDMTQWQMSLRNESYAIGAYLFQPLHGIPSFPFLKATIYGAGWLWFRHDYGYEPISGLLPAAPFLLLTPFVFRKSDILRNKVVQFLALSGIAGLVLSGAAAVYRRYAVGFYPFFIIAALLILSIATTQDRFQILRRLVFLTMSFSLFYGFFASFGAH